MTVQQRAGLVALAFIAPIMVFAGASTYSTPKVVVPEPIAPSPITAGNAVNIGKAGTVNNYLGRPGILTRAHEAKLAALVEKRLEEK